MLYRYFTVFTESYFFFKFFYNTTTGSVEKYLLVTGYAVPECSPDWLFSKVKLAKLPHSESHNATMKGSLEEIGDKVMQMQYQSKFGQFYSFVLCDLIHDIYDILLYTEKKVIQTKVLVMNWSQIFFGDLCRSSRSTAIGKSKVANRRCYSLNVMFLISLGWLKCVCLTVPNVLSINALEIWGVWKKNSVNCYLQPTRI